MLLHRTPGLPVREPRCPAVDDVTPFCDHDDGPNDAPVFERALNGAVKPNSETNVPVVIARRIRNQFVGARHEHGLLLHPPLPIQRHAAACLAGGMDTKRIRREQASLSSACGTERLATVGGQGHGVQESGRRCYSTTASAQRQMSGRERERRCGACFEDHTRLVFRSYASKLASPLAADGELNISCMAQRFSQGPWRRFARL